MLGTFQNSRVNWPGLPSCIIKGLIAPGIYSLQLCMYSACLSS
jgi:hypothetical protein